MQKDNSQAGRNRRKETQKIKKGRYQNIWTHGKGKKSRKKRCLQCRKMQNDNSHLEGIEEKKTQKAKKEDIK